MKVIVIAAAHFDDGTLEPLLQKLHDAGAQVDFASTEPGMIVGNGGMTIIVEHALVQIKSENYDMLIIPGGESANNVRHHPFVPEIIKSFFSMRKPVVAIKEGVGAIAGANVVRGRKVCSVPSLTSELKGAGAKIQDAAVFKDHFLLTLSDDSGLDQLLEDVLSLVNAT